MKRKFALGLILVMALALIGCSSEGGVVTTDESNNPAGKPPEGKSKVGGKPGPSGMPPMGADGKAGI